MFGNQLLRFENIYFFKLGNLSMLKFICCSYNISKPWEFKTPK